MNPRKKILVTGGSGLLGQKLCKHLSSQYDTLGISKSGKLGTLICDFTKLDEITSFFKKNSPDLVINTAAYSDVDGCERDPGLAHAANALAVKYLAHLCGEIGAPLVHISTDYVFDGKKNTPYVESDATGPVNIYGLTKLGGEYYAQRCKSPSAIVRTSWLFGSESSSNFVSVLASRLKTEKLVSVLDDQQDAPTYCGDLCLALEKIATRLFLLGHKEKINEIYHVCNSGFTTRYEMTVKMKEILGLSQTQVLKTETKSIRGRLAVRPRYVVMSNALFQDTFGMKLRPWEESLKEYLLN